MKISVIIPAFNRAPLLGQTLKSLLRQSLPPYEILVVDDGSTDGTPEIAESFGQPVRVIRQQNSGPAAARNRGFKESSGELIQFFDSDDLATSPVLESRAHCIQRQGCDVAYGPWVKGEITESTFRPENHVLQQKGLPPGKSLIYHLLADWSTVPMAYMLRREYVEKSGGFPTHLRIGEDQSFFLRCLIHGARVSFEPNGLILYREGNAGKLTTSGTPDSEKALHWARFLLDSRKLCLQAGETDPLRWNDFKMRLWTAWEDIRLHPSGIDHPTGRELKTLVDTFRHPWLYPAARRLQQVRGGLQQRLTGGRAGASFCSAPLGPQQLQQIKSMGLNIVQ